MADTHVQQSSRGCVTSRAEVKADPANTTFVGCLLPFGVPPLFLYHPLQYVTAQICSWDEYWGVDIAQPVTQWQGSDSNKNTKGVFPTFFSIPVLPYFALPLISPNGRKLRKLNRFCNLCEWVYGCSFMSFNDKIYIFLREKIQTRSEIKFELCQNNNIERNNIFLSLSLFCIYFFSY